MRHSRKSLRSRSIGAILVLVALTATLLATLVLGASAATAKTSHVKRVNAHRTTAHPMRSQGGTVPTAKPPLTG